MKFLKNSNLSGKVNSFSDGTYAAVTGLAYDATNKKLGIKVGADAVIPFSGEREIEIVPIANSGTSADQWYTVTLPDGYLGFIAVCSKGCRNNDTNRVSANISATGLSSYWNNQLAVPVYNGCVTKTSVGFIPGTTQSMSFYGWADGQVLLLGIRYKS